jgi:hypothetical protein
MLSKDHYRQIWYSIAVVSAQIDISKVIFGDVPALHLFEARPWFPTAPQPASAWETR